LVGLFCWDLGGDGRLTVVESNWKKKVIYEINETNKIFIFFTIISFITCTIECSRFFSISNGCVFFDNCW
jgi:hypothetical protein